MNGLQRHVYRIWLNRFLGTLCVLLIAMGLSKGLKAFFRTQLSQSVWVSVTASCAVLLQASNRYRTLSKPAGCAFKSPRSLPLLWSMGYTKKLSLVTLNELIWIPGIGPEFGRRIRMNRHVTNWGALARRASISKAQLERLRLYVSL